MRGSALLFGPAVRPLARYFKRERTSEAFVPPKP